jgi:C-terminal processing protease CtpA/Prc
MSPRTRFLLAAAALAPPLASHLSAQDPWQRYASPGLATPFQEQLTEDERLAGLALLWSEVKYNFANFDLVPDLDWDAAFRRAIPGVRAASDTLAYYRELQRLSAVLRDGHTFVSLPAELRDRAEARPPLRTMVVEGRVFVALVRSPQLRELGLAARQEILRVDGVPVVDYAERTFGPYVCASTPQDRTAQLLVRHLLAGPADRAVTLTIAEPGKQPRDVVVPRRGLEVDPPRPSYSLAMLPQNVALVTIDTFNDPGVAKAFAADFERILPAAGLILDIRENGGGSSTTGYAILAHLTEEPFLGSRWRTPEYRPAFRAWNRAPAPYGQDGSSNAPIAGPRFRGPVAVLIGARTYSAAEDFAVAFDAMQRGPLVGEPTGGSTGQPLTVRLPGGGAARICTKRDSYPSGKEFVGVGVQPTAKVAPTVADLLAGRDPVLERALEIVAAPK